MSLEKNDAGTTQQELDELIDKMEADFIEHMGGQRAVDLFSKVVGIVREQGKSEAHKLWVEFQSKSGAIQHPDTPHGRFELASMRALFHAAVSCVVDEMNDRIKADPLAAAEYFAKLQRDVNMEILASAMELTKMRDELKAAEAAGPMRDMTE